MLHGATWLAHTPLLSCVLCVSKASEGQNLLEKKQGRSSRPSSRSTSDWMMEVFVLSSEHLLGAHVCYLIPSHNSLQTRCYYCPHCMVSEPSSIAGDPSDVPENHQGEDHTTYLVSGREALCVSSIGDAHRGVRGPLQSRVNTGLTPWPQTCQLPKSPQLGTQPVCKGPAFNTPTPTSPTSTEPFQARSDATAHFLPGRKQVPHRLWAGAAFCAPPWARHAFLRLGQRGW